MQRVLVTGGSGFIGINLIESLLRDQIEVLSFDSKDPIDGGKKFAFASGDILDSERLKATMSDFKPSYVVHLAARVDLAGTAISEYVANTKGVQNVIDAVKATSAVSRVIFASSRYVHANEVQPARDDQYTPFTLYGESKAQGEKIVRASNLDVPWVIIRPTSIWGPWFGIPYKGFFEAVRKGMYVHPAGEKLFKSYGFVGNVVHQIRRLMAVPSELIHRRTLYSADYEPIEVRAMAEQIRLAFAAPPVREAPLRVLKVAALAGDILKKVGVYNPPLSSFRLNNLRCQMVYNLNATEEIVGPLPYQLPAGVAATVDWMKTRN